MVGLNGNQKELKMRSNNILINVPIVVLILHATLNLFRGSAHFFLSDGGSILIAGLDIGSGVQKQIIITILQALGQVKLFGELFNFMYYFMQKN